jgi:peptidyl-prolyl cis-trans isomerase SurA
MKKIILSIWFLAILFSVGAQKYSADLFKVGGESVTANEFIKTFNKNNSLKNATESELRDYLDLYVNFKLKVMDGIDYKIDTATTFQKELASYKSQSAQQYLVDKEVTERLMKEAIERSKQMIHASHILIICETGASPKDTLAALNKILDIRKKLVAKAITFPDAAVQFSDDISARDEVTPTGKTQFGNKGDLGYFTAFDLVYPFESAAYNTAIGAISMPVRTQFGYHLVWVQDKQPIVSKINISQILLLDTAARFGRISPNVQEKLSAIEEAFKNGEDFSTLAEKFTDDPMSKSKGGQLEPFPPNRRPGSFIKQCITLEKDQISKPFSSVIGWHFIKLNEIIKPATKDDEIKYTMNQKIQRDSRSTKSVESLIAKLKKEYKFSDKGKNDAFAFILKKLSTENKMPPAIDFLDMAEIGSLKPIATFAQKTVTIQDFINFLDRFKGDELNNKVQEFLNRHYENFMKETMIKYEFDNLENKYPEYKELITEYHHGMILFEMTNEKIWSVSLQDSTKLEEFYEKIKFDYLNSAGVPKPFADIRSAVLTEYQNELEKVWIAGLKEKYPVWINEDLFELILKNK